MGAFKGIKKMKELSKFIFLFIGFIAFAQSPWTQKKNFFYTQFSFSTIPNYDTLFGDSDSSVEGKLSDTTFQLYGEYGLTNKTTLVVYIPYKLISNKGLANRCLIGSCPEYSNEKRALGNIEIGIRHNFYKKSWVLSFQSSIEINSGSYDALSGISSGYNALTFTPLFLIGKSTKKDYMQTFIGTNIRTNNYSSNFKIGGEYGRKFGKNFWFIGFLDVVKSFKNGSVVLPSLNSSTGLFVNNQEFGAFGFKGTYEINNKLGINSGLGSAFFGNNVPKRIAYSFGIYSKF